MKNIFLRISLWVEDAIIEWSYRIRKKRNLSQLTHEEIVRLKASEQMSRFIEDRGGRQWISEISALNIEQQFFANPSYSDGFVNPRRVRGLGVLSWVTESTCGFK